MPEIVDIETVFDENDDDQMVVLVEWTGAANHGETVLEAKIDDPDEPWITLSADPTGGTAVLEVDYNKDYRVRVRAETDYETTNWVTEDVTVLSYAHERGVFEITPVQQERGVFSPDIELTATAEQETSLTGRVTSNLEYATQIEQAVDLSGSLDTETAFTTSLEP